MKKLSLVIVRSIENRGEKLQYFEYYIWQIKKKNIA